MPRTSTDPSEIKTSSQLASLLISWVTSGPDTESISQPSWVPLDSMLRVHDPSSTGYGRASPPTCTCVSQKRYHGLASRRVTVPSPWRHGGNIQSTEFEPRNTVTTGWPTPSSSFMTWNPVFEGSCNGFTVMGGNSHSGTHGQGRIPRRRRAGLQGSGRCADGRRKAG